ncbi:MAG TPA: hypothetical protein VGP46_13040, partial [Acidimicrobiales bacterium]|nr:hypothetical protein [Acidimicrobiales bacterium]
MTEPLPAPVPSRPGSKRPASRRHPPRPERFIVPVGGGAVLLAAWAAVAHASGSGWVQAIGAIAAGIAFVGLAAPAAAATRLRVQCVACPRDATAGEPFEIELVASAALRCTPRRPRGDTTIIPARHPVRLKVTAPNRGVMRAVRVKLATATPLGLLWWSVDRIVRLPVEIHVA